MTVESSIGILNPQQVDQIKAFIKGHQYLEQVKNGVVKEEHPLLDVVRGFMFGIARELQSDGKGGLIKDMQREVKKEL